MVRAESALLLCETHGDLKDINLYLGSISRQWHCRRTVLTPDVCWGLFACAALGGGNK